MSAAPQWLDEVIMEFGHCAGMKNLSLGERGVIALKGDKGLMFTLEYVYPKLFVRVTVDVSKTIEVAKKVLMMSEANRQGRFLIRSGFMSNSDKAFFVVSLTQDKVTLPILTDAFNDMRRLAERFVGGAI